MKPVKRLPILPDDDTEFENLVSRIVSLVSETKTKILRNIDDTLVITNWYIREYIVEFEQKWQSEGILWGRAVTQSIQAVDTSARQRI